MKPHYPNMHRLFQTILTEDAYPGSAVSADLDGDDYDTIPLVTWRAMNDGQVDHGKWNVLLIVHVLIDLAESDMDAVLSHVYAQIQSWNKPGRGVLADEKYGVLSVEDSAVFNLVNQSMLNGKQVAQFTSQFRIIVQDWS